MNREQKTAAVKHLAELFGEKPHVILATFRGLTVNQSADLRAKIRESGGTYKVIKNRLAKRAAQGTPAETISAEFSGPCAVATHDSDPVVLAKTLAAFAKDHPELELKAGVIDAKESLDAAGVKHLSTLPGLPEQRATLLSLLQTPAMNLVRLLQTPAIQLARVIEAKSEGQDGAS